MSTQLVGSFRHTHSRLNEFAEEIAFLEGEETEKLLLEREYGGVIKHENRVLRARWWHGCLEEVSQSLKKKRNNNNVRAGDCKMALGVVRCRLI